MSNSGWHPDPTHRFGQRYYDGSSWTDHVVGAQGQVVTDPLPPADTPFPPPRPVASAPPPPPAGAAPAFAAVPPTPHATHGHAGGGQVSYRPGAGLACGVLGLLLLLLGLLALPWADASRSRFTDLSSGVRDAGSDAVDDLALYHYAAWLGFALLVLLLVLVVLSGVPLPRSSAGNSVARVIGALLAGLGLVLHVVTVTHVFRGPATPAFGAWVGAAGYVVLLVAMVLGARRVIR